MISKNGLAILIMATEMILSAFGIEFEPGSVAKAVEGGVLLVSFLLLVWNQITRRDVDWFIFKK